MQKIREMLSDAEVELAQAANTGHTGNANEAHALAQLYVSRQLRAAADDVIGSNERVAAASNRTATSLNWLTGALVLAAVAQAVVMWSVGRQ